MHIDGGEILMNIYVGSFGQVYISDETLRETHNLDRRRSDVRTFERDVNTILETEWENDWGFDLVL